MRFEDVLKLLIGSVEAKDKPGQLVQACKKLNMKPHEYFNIYGEPLYSIRYDLIFDTPNGEKGRLEIIEVDGGDLLQAGFQIGYKDNNTLDIEFSSLHILLKEHYIQGREELLGQIKFANETTQCHLINHKLNNQFALNLGITNKEIWRKYIRMISSKF
jgi:hypothetical protein